MISNYFILREISIEKLHLSMGLHKYTVKLSILCYTRHHILKLEKSQVINSLSFLRETMPCIGLSAKGPLNADSLAWSETCPYGFLFLEEVVQERIFSQYYQFHFSVSIVPRFLHLLRFASHRFHMILAIGNVVIHETLQIISQGSYCG
jgi:hypothetical protein